MREGLNGYDFYIRYFDSRMLKHEAASLEKLKARTDTLKALLQQILDSGVLADTMARNVRKELK